MAGWWGSTGYLFNYFWSQHSRDLGFLQSCFAGRLFYPDWGILQNTHGGVCDELEADYIGPWNYLYWPNDWSPKDNLFLFLQDSLTGYKKTKMGSTWSHPGSIYAYTSNQAAAKSNRGSKNIPKTASSASRVNMRKTNLPEGSSPSPQEPTGPA
jgi:hypothetical protein